jgi:hypothetical protein
VRVGPVYSIEVPDTYYCWSKIGRELFKLVKDLHRTAVQSSNSNCIPSCESLTSRGKLAFVASCGRS